MSTDFQFLVTFFQNYAAGRKWERLCSIYDLADLARDVTAPSKETLPWVKLARFGERRTDKHSLRHDDNVLAITGVEADYDGGEMPFDEAIEVIDKLGLMALIYTSPSHTEDSPRWRVLCPLSVEMPPAERRHMLGRLNGAFGGIFSGESWTLSQSYYYGSVNQNPSHRVEVLLGHTLDQLDDLDGEGWIGPSGGDPRAANDGTVTKETREDAELIRRAITGDGYHVEMCALCARYIGRNIPAETVTSVMQALLLSHPESSRDERWIDRYESIPELVASAVAKYRADSDAADTAKRKPIAALACRLIRERQRATEVRAAVLAAARDANIPSEDAERIIKWAGNQELARRGIHHAA